MPATPARVNEDDCRRYRFFARGLRFLILMHDNFSDNMTDLCCMSSKKKPIFKANCENDLLDSVEHFFATTPDP